MSLYENFPYTNLHELNLDWIINTLNQLKESQVLSVNGMTGEVILYQNAIMQLPTVEDDHWSIIRMADGTQRGIMFANDGTAYIVHGNSMSQMYSVNNQPPYPVTRVNGQTGDITLYSDQYVQLPSLTDAQMQNWTFFRTLNNVSRGIQFNDDGTADIINGTSRYRIYDKNAFPSIGTSGSIVLFTENNNLLNLPADAQAASWGMARTVSGTEVGFSISSTGDVSIKVGNDTYPVYTGKDPGWVNDPEDDTIIINTEAATPEWGFIRETTEGYVGILFSNDPQLTEPAAYLQYIDSNDQTQTIKLLTPADIPSSAGVVSINGLAGVVQLTGNDIPMSDQTPTTISTRLFTLNSYISSISQGMADTYDSTATYQAGDYVTRSNVLYMANKTTTGTWTAADWDAVNVTDPIQSLLGLVTGVQTVQKQVSTATSYTCSDPSGEYYQITDLNYTPTVKSLVIATCHIEITSTKQYLNYRIGESWCLANTRGTSHFLNNSYAGVYNANTTIPFRIRLEDGESITYGNANMIQAGITYTVIPLE